MRVADPVFVTFRQARAIALALTLLLPWAAAAPADPPVPPPAPPPAPAPGDAPPLAPLAPPAPPGPPAPAPQDPGPAPGPQDPKPAPAKEPQLVPDRPEHDFGKAGQNQKLDVEFKLKNVGATPIKVTKLIADCGCYAATVSANEVAPGAEVTVKVRFETLVWSGQLTKRLRVLTDDPARPELVLPLKVNVVAGVVLDPGRFGFGDVMKGSTPEKVLYAKWYEGVGEPFKVTGVEFPASPDAFDVKMEPFERLPWRGTKITITFRQPPPLGHWNGMAIVRTDAPGFERLDLPVQAFVSGRVWVQERDVNLGWVKEGQGRTRTLSVRPFRHGDDLGVVNARARGGNVTVEVVPDPSGRPGLWALAIQVPASAPKGHVEDVVELLTSVPGEETTEIRVRAEVM